MTSVAVSPVVSDTQNINHQPSATTTPSAVDQGVHAYKCPGEGDIRSVCPALNTIANHSYIPHNGKQITFSTLVHALHAGYGISIGFASFLVLGTYILLRRNPLKPIDLHEISRHSTSPFNGVEHNGSVVHEDADGEKYAPSQVNTDLLRKFLSKAYSPAEVRKSEDENVITVEDLAYTRIARQAASGPVDALHAEIARGEFAMVFDIFGNGTEKTLNKDDLAVWMTYNKFPEGWAPKHTETLSQTVAESKKMRNLVEAYKRGGKQEEHGLWFSIEKAVEGLVQKVETTAHLHGIGMPDAAFNGGEKRE